MTSFIDVEVRDAVAERCIESSMTQCEQVRLTPRAAPTPASISLIPHFKCRVHEFFLPSLLWSPNAIHTRAANEEKWRPCNGRRSWCKFGRLL